MESGECVDLVSREVSSARSLGRRAVQRVNATSDRRAKVVLATVLRRVVCLSVSHSVESWSVEVAAPSKSPRTSYA